MVQIHDMALSTTLSVSPFTRIWSVACKMGGYDATDFVPARASFFIQMAAQQHAFCLLHMSDFVVTVSSLMMYGRICGTNGAETGPNDVRLSCSVAVTKLRK
eukprot:CAMPEP_0197851182 /NCGR_PEP_ID=MMETSP1438-20131217/17484_1 /TAXON_ID=1461541 /ORGANISM="Pterosperma sp., Strain CCMP1384" /LENGTH=101 /DNA_ID=CAMNT_0043464703 /DNA_START=272 /DNA_END=577 /DNA_ORIENTATION=-